MPGAIDWPSVHAEALEVLRGYIQIDTSNPPGNEAPAARYLGRLLEAEADCKSSGAPEATICSRALLEIAVNAPTRRRRRAG